MNETTKRFALLGGIGAAAGMAAWQIASKNRLARLKGQVVVITGGSRGLGLELAHQFAGQGCRLALCARSSEELESARRELEARGADVYVAVCDVRSREQVDRFIGAVISHFGCLDILVNNAGVIQVGPLESMKIEDFEQAMEVMFWGVLYPTWAAIPHMTGRGSGRIVTITSIGGKVSVPHLLPYSCAKFASVALSEGLRTELAPKGIQVLTVVPGLMRTGSFLNALFKGNQKEEFGWFGLGATLPGLSMSSKRAASQIVSAVRGGKSEIILSAPAQIMARFHGAFPELTSVVLGLVNHLLMPSGEGGSKESITGHEADGKLDSLLYKAFTMLGRTAAERLHENVRAEA
jgi:NAD(P)-dependent dehydrogenase (short-subunit alcohol dehydrogenase family)